MKKVFITIFLMTGVMNSVIANTNTCDLSVSSTYDKQMGTRTYKGKDKYHSAPLSLSDLLGFTSHTAEYYAFGGYGGNEEVAKEIAETKCRRASNRMREKENQKFMTCDYPECSDDEDAVCEVLGRIYKVSNKSSAMIQREKCEKLFKCQQDTLNTSVANSTTNLLNIEILIDSHDCYNLPEEEHDQGL